MGKIAGQSGPVTGKESAVGALSRREAETALRGLRRRMWTIRRVSFTIAYVGVLTVLLVAPWIAAGYVLWQSGAFTQIRAQILASMPNVTAGSQPMPLPMPSSSATSLQRWLITEEEATAWLQRLLGANPAIQQAKVGFRLGTIEVTGTVAIPATHPLLVRLSPQITNDDVGATLLLVAVGQVPDPAATALVRPYLETWVGQLAAEMNRPYAYATVHVDEGTLLVTGRLRP